MSIRNSPYTIPYAKEFPWAPPEPWIRAPRSKPAAFKPKRGPVFDSYGITAKPSRSPTRQYARGGPQRGHFDPEHTDRSWCVGKHASPRESVRYMRKKK